MIDPRQSSKAYWAAEDDFLRRWKDNSFRRGEKEAVRRERNRLIKIGVIIPAEVRFSRTETKEIVL